MYLELKKFEVLDKIQDLEIINLGTGMGYYDFCYKELPLNAFNFSLPQQNLYFDYQMLKKYSYLMKKNCTICIVLPYCIFCADCLEEAMPRYERYYALLSREDVEPYCSVPYDSRCILNIREIPAQDDALKYALQRSEMERQSEEAIVVWKKQLGIVSFASGEVSSHTKKEIEKSQRWLKRILDYCEYMKFIPVVIVPPMSQTLLDKIGRRFRKINFYDILYTTVSDNIQILDYSDDSFFCNPKLFGWPGFLVEKAAQIFTKDVIERLRLG